MNDNTTSQPMQHILEIADAHQRNKVIRALYRRSATLQARGNYRKANDINYRVSAILEDDRRETLEQMRDEAYEQRRQIEDAYRQRLREMDDAHRARLDELYEKARQEARDER